MVALFEGEVGEREDVGNGGKEHGVVREKALSPGARTVADAMSDAVTFISKDLKLMSGVLGHGEMEAKSAIGGGAIRDRHKGWA